MMESRRPVARRHPQERSRGDGWVADGEAGVGVGRLVTARELAAVLNVAPKTVYDWVRQGHVRGLRLGRGRMLRFDAQDVLRQLKAREEG